MLPPKLAQLDPKIVEHVFNEVTDSCGGITWDDIAGQDAAKRLVQEMVVWPMLNPQLFTVGVRVRVGRGHFQAQVRRRLRGWPRVHAAERVVCDAAVGAHGARPVRLYEEAELAPNCRRRVRGRRRAGCCCSVHPAPARR